MFAMPQSGTGVSVEAVDPVFQTKMLDMLKQTGRWGLLACQSSVGPSAALSDPQPEGLTPTVASHRAPCSVHMPRSSRKMVLVENEM